MIIAEGWHPVALSALIEPGTSAGTHIDEIEYVVWRDDAGRAHLWEDRCPHRGMKLSFGFVRGDHIACLYHGWQYGPTGRCRYIPAHPDLEVPKTIAVPVFATHESGGMIWAAASDESAPPQVDGEFVPLRSLYLDSDLETTLSLLGENLPQPFSGTNETAIEAAGGNLQRIRTGDDTLLVGLQRIAPDRSALHIVLFGTAGRDAGRKQAHFLRWASALRNTIEAYASTRPAPLEAAQ